jgi:mannosyltransferase
MATVATTERAAAAPPPERPPAGRNGPLLLTTVATVVAAALSLWRIGDKSLWYDETFTVGLVDRPLGDALWRITHWELNQSPYYVVLLGWHHLGDGETFLRLPSAAFAVATVPVVYAIGRRLSGPWVGALAAAVVAVHAQVIQWGQQVRGYSLALLLDTVAALLLLRAVERPTTGRAVAFGVVAAAAGYSHFAALLVVGALGASLLLFRPVPWRLVRVAGGTAAVLLGPLA